jgi:zinc transport system substrate-binding protein
MLAGALAAAGCGGGGKPAATAGGRTTVVAAFFPLAEAARVVGGDRVQVTNLTPPGVEPHDLELTTKAVDEVAGADVVVIMGQQFQPAVEKVAATRSSGTVEIFKALGMDGKDPHIWLDPSLMERIVGVVADGLAHADPAHAAQLRANAKTFDAQLAALDARFASKLAHCQRTVIVASHEAYGYLARRYHLRQESITGLIPDAEPDPAKLDELARLVQREHVTTVFNEPLLPKRAAETLAREAHVKVASLDPLESDPGHGYVAAMDANLATLAAGLGC